MISKTNRIIVFMVVGVTIGITWAFLYAYGCPLWLVGVGFFGSIIVALVGLPALLISCEDNEHE